MLESEKHKSFQDRKKCFAYIAAFIVFQTIIILVFSLTVMRIKTPKVRVRSVTIENLRYPKNSTASPYFNLTLVAQVTVKNTNFGHFKFDNSTANMTYGGVVVGDGVIVKGRAKARRTKRMNVTMEVKSDEAVDETKLRSDLNSGSLTLRAEARVRGKVTLMMIMKKRKTARMNCSVTIFLANSTVQDLKC